MASNVSGNIHGVRQMIKCTDKFAFFYTEWPSNFAKTSFTWEAFGEKPTFFCTEQAFMWAKAKYFGDETSSLKIIAEQKSPMACKQLGRLVENYDDKKWSLVRYSFMHDVNYEKYKQDLELRAKLLNPQFDNKTFVEASPTDRIWGVGLAQDDPKIEDERNWRGQNLLGKVITQVRAEIIHDFGTTI